MRLRALFVLLALAFSASNVGAQIDSVTGLILPCAAVAADDAGARTNGQINGSSWSVNAPIPEPRGSSQGATLASSDGSLIYSVGGGCCHSDYPDGINRLWAYSPKDDSWSAAADVPVSDGIRAYGSAVELNGFIYVFGGVAGPASNPRMLNTTWIYDEANDGWFEGANMPDF